MVTKTYSLKGGVNANQVVVYHYYTYGLSPRVKGKLKLQAQTCNLTHAYTHGNAGGDPSCNLPYGYTAETLSPIEPISSTNGYWIPLENGLYAQFIRKLHNASPGYSGDVASLGVTLGEWHSSAAMIKARALNVSSTLSAIAGKYERYAPGSLFRRRSGREWRTITANTILEGEFGWAPLISDLLGAAKVLASGIPPAWVTVRAKRHTTELASWPDNANPPRWVGTDVWTIDYSSTYSCQVQVSNPNIWLLNQLGLINPLTVAEDLIPWSFVVNMFVNIKQVLGSFTDLAGLTISNSSLTRSAHCKRETFLVASKNPGIYFGNRSSSSTRSLKYRWVGVSIPSPRLQIHLPSISVETAAIAGSLMFQNVRRLENAAMWAFGYKDPGRLSKEGHRALVSGISQLTKKLQRM